MIAYVCDYIDITLFISTVKMISQIIHLSDIHIRAGNQDKSRYHEYHSTFTNLFQSIEHLPGLSEAIIVITGDIFHHKNKLEPCGLELALHLLSGLASLAPVYLIRGNHDYRQDVPNEHDMITALMSYNIKNVTYLDKTGTYYHNNIGIGLVAIQDTLLYGSTSGISSELPPFPVPDNAEYKIALFHGTISGTTLQTNTHMLHGYPIDWFQGFDAILLGDIHLHQVHRVNTVELSRYNTYSDLPHTMHTATYEYEDTVPWGYPGSLIQQDFGESLIGHGYMVWNLKEKQIHAFHINNQYGFLKIRDNQILSPYTCNELMQHMPLNLKLTTIGNCQEIVAKLVDNGKNILFIKTSEQKQLYDENEEKKEQKDISQINSIDVLMDYIQNIITTDNKLFSNQWRTWMRNPEKLIISTANFPEALAKKVAERSDKIHKAAKKYMDDFEKFASQHTITGTFHIHSIQWNWILNYKDSNSYDFDKSINQISIINAKNGAGKSNFLEIICIALFGEGFPSRENSNYSAGIICDKKPDGVSPNTTIVFSINNIKYKLYRAMRTNTISRLINYDKIILSVVGEKEEILHQQKGAVHPWIESNIGTIDTYLMTAMLSQNADRDFYTLDKPTQKTLLDRIMSLDHINSLKAFLKETEKYYKHVCELIETYYDGATGGRDPLLLEQLENAKRNAELSTALCSELRTKWNHIPEQKLSQLDIDKATEQYNEWTDMSKQPVVPLSELRPRLTELEQDIASFSAILHEYKWFSLNVLDASDASITLAKLNKNKTHIAYLKKMLEEHPFYKTHSLNQSNVEEYCNDDYANDDCSQELFQANRDFETWNMIKFTEFKEFKEFNEMKDSNGVKEIQYALDKCDSILKEYPLKIANSVKRMKLMRKKFALKRKEKDEHLEKRPNKPSKSVNWLENTAENIAEYDIAELTSQEKCLALCVQHVAILSTTILSLTNNIQNMEKYVLECSTIPFNAKCKSCRSQPWKKTHDEYLAELPLLKTQLMEKQSELDAILYKEVTFHIHNYEVYLLDVERELHSTRDAIALYHLYQAENKLHEDYEEWSITYEVLCTECDGAESAYENLENMCKEDENVIVKATAEKHELESKLVKMNHKKQEYEVYCNELEIRKKQFEDNTEKIKYNWYSVLHEYHTYVYNLVTFVTNHLQGLNTEHSSIQNSIAQCQNAKERDEKAAELLCSMNAYPEWKEWKAEVEKQQNYMLLIRELETKQGGKVGVGIDLDGLKETATVITYLSDKFDGYREWLYKNNIGPMIEEHVNKVLQVICDERPLYLETEWLDKINTLSWFVRDGTSRPVIEKASGFQRFIVGMATRVAFHQIGFCRIQCDQLFIDEGFTSCDSDNLEKVPEFLRGLLTLYNSIYLATHLDELKGCSHTQICIQRDSNGLSHIRYGDVEMIEPVKKKGRPVKNKVNVVRSE